MKPNYSEMTRKELRAYVIRNREDEEAIEYLIRTAKMDGKKYPLATTEEELQEQQEAINAKIRELEEKERRDS